MRSYKFFLSCITAVLISFVHVSISYAHGDFTVLTSESFDQTWQKGKKSHLTRGVWEEFWCVNEPIS